MKARESAATAEGGGTRTPARAPAQGRGGHAHALWVRAGGSGPTAAEDPLDRTSTLLSMVSLMEDFARLEGRFAKLKRHGDKAPSQFSV